MPQPPDPADLSVAERLTELARLLATGYLRARQRAATPLTEKRLDVPGEPRHPCVGSLTGRESAHGGIQRELAL